MSHIAIDARIISSSTGRYVIRLIQNLEKIDNENTYSILIPSEDIDYYRPQNPNFNVVKVDIENYSFAEQIDFLKVLNKLKADLVHFCMPQQPVLYSGKHVTTIHDLTLLKTTNSSKNKLNYSIKKSIGKRVFKHVIKSSSYIFVPSDYTKNEVINFLPKSEKKILRTYESADNLSGSIEKPMNIPYDKYLLYVGSQNDYKNIKRLAEAHQTLLRSNPDLGLVLVGDFNNPTNENKKHFNKINYSNIMFTGHVNDAELVWLYKHASAYVFPSLMEGFGLPGLEAMYCGLPVISSNATCLPEIYGDAAYYFNPYDVNDMVSSIDKVLKDDELRNDMISKGYDQAKKYSWEKMARQTLAYYKRTLLLENN